MYIEKQYRNTFSRMFRQPKGEKVQQFRLKDNRGSVARQRKLIQRVEGEVVPEKMTIANEAIRYAKRLVTHGPQNQQWARRDYGDEGDVNMRAMISLIDLTTFQDASGQRVQGDYNHRDWMRPRRVGAAVAATGGGNCQDIAALTYNFLREKSKKEWTICFVVNPSQKHAFATIGNPNQYPRSTIVADAWVRDAKAIPLSEHFCSAGPFQILKLKRGGKTDRIRNLQSKYWDINRLPQWVANEKSVVRVTFARVPAIYNVESPYLYPNANRTPSNVPAASTPYHILIDGTRLSGQPCPSGQSRRPRPLPAFVCGFRTRSSV